MVGTTCHGCGAHVDALRDPKRIVGTRIVTVCRPCAAGVVTAASTPRPIDIRATRPSAIEPVDRVEPLIALPPPPRERARIPATVVSAACLLAACGAAAIIGPRVSSSARAKAPDHTHAAVVAESDLRIPSPDPSPAPAPALSPLGGQPATAIPPLLEQKPPRPTKPPVAIPEIPPGTFVHPIPGPDRDLPRSSTRIFGAWRDGERAPECGEGHCGVDLGKHIGTPILAARSGVVFNAHRSPDGRSGRFVHIRHDDGMATWYMHLDTVREDLRPGVEVRAGEPIGTLGKSGIHNSAPHLHFAITIGEEWDQTYVDPLPFLRDAIVVDVTPPVELASQQP